MVLGGSVWYFIAHIISGICNNYKYQSKLLVFDNAWIIDYDNNHTWDKVV